MFNLTHLFKKKFTYPKSVKPSYTGYKALMADEVVLLRESLKQHTPPPIPTIIEPRSVQTIWGTPSEQQVIWQISFKDKPIHYMSSNGNYGDCYVVYVDTELLYLILLIDGLKSNGDDAIEPFHKLRKDLPTDYKYHYAEEAFAKSVESPIPLALIHAGEPSNKPSIFFTDGITRTIWLIANHALSFPIFTQGAESAHLLNDLVGLTDQPFKISHLISRK